MWMISCPTMSDISGKTISCVCYQLCLIVQVCLFVSEFYHPFRRKPPRDVRDIEESDDDFSETELDEFESGKSVRNLTIQVTDELIDRCATQLSSNDMVVGRARSANLSLGTVGTVRQLAMDKSL